MSFIRSVKQRKDSFRFVRLDSDYFLFISNDLCLDYEFH
jgi:hypothetical protein